jgi:flagellar basal body-associated protein FliL
VLKNKKILLALVPIVALAVWLTALRPEPPKEKAKVEGDAYVLPKEFLVALRGSRFAKVSVALLLEHGAGAEPEGGEEGAKPPEGYGPLPQEALVRDIVTDELTGQPARRLTSRKGRDRLEKRIAKRLHEATDVPAHEVLFMDVAVQ